MTEQMPQQQPAGQDTWKKFRGRYRVVLFVFIAAFIAIGFRLVTIQVIEAGKYQALARKQYERAFILPAVRGNMYDRNGNILASNTMYVSFGADPHFVGNKIALVAETFASVFGKSQSYYLEKLRNKNEEQGSKHFVWLERGVKPELAKQIDDAKLQGVIKSPEPRRIYHYDDLAGCLIGFTNIDNKGISGIELQCDNTLKGVSGSVVMQQDGLGRVRPSADYPRREPTNGNNVHLTIDVTYQAIVDEELKRGVEANKADGGVAVMLNPKTGEVLAMSTFPGIDPNNTGKIDMAAARNRVVSDLFEPGSVFKIVTAAAAYEQHVVTPETRINAEHGKMKVPLGGSKFRIISDTHEYDWLTFQQGLELSSNIVFAKVGKVVGGETLYRYARDFGFGIFTGIDLPGEVRGIIKKPGDPTWSGTTLQTMSYGYEVGVTPLQIACAYAAIANHGELMKPFVVSSIQDGNGTMMYEQRPQMIRRVASQKTIDLLTAAFEGVVERGTGKGVHIEGVRIAGKTGTSRKYVEGKYAANSYTASFVGYFPIDDPQVVCLVMMDNPRVNGYYGGTTSGPIFHAIAERIITTSYKFSRTAIAQEPNQNGSIAVPDVRMLQPLLAKRILEGCGLNSQTFGSGTIVLRQSPEPGKKVEKNESIALILNSDSTVTTNGTITVPDVRGMSVRRAMNRLVIDDFSVKLQGNGVVASQLPAAGVRVPLGSEVLLQCEPHGLASTALY
jgi:cell division protein FtsI (penicillin-binding protein 3)